TTTSRWWPDSPRPSSSPTSIPATPRIPAACWPTSATSTGFSPNGRRSAGKPTGTAPASTPTSPRTGSSSWRCAARPSPPPPPPPLPPPPPPPHHPPAPPNPAGATAPPDTPALLVRQAGNTYDQLEDWARPPLPPPLSPDG